MLQKIWLVIVRVIRRNRDSSSRNNQDEHRYNATDAQRVASEERSPRLGKLTEPTWQDETRAFPPPLTNRQSPSRRYVFVTGGVVSTVGKGVTAASIGRMVKSRGLSVAIMKLDPYINVDPGTMNPLEHGEVFVTIDGAETDLDLGHYERFVDENLTGASNLTTGAVYDRVIARERRGDFLGGTIQVIPHVTDEIKSRIRAVGDRHNPDVVIVEVGGTVGDIENIPFLEALRQMRREVGTRNVLFVHVTLVPRIGTTEELKTKPTQHSVRELRSIGIQPDVVVCRSDEHLTADLIEKIALFADVDRRAVISNPDVESIYEVPLMLEKAGLGAFINRHFELPEVVPGLDEWRATVQALLAPLPELEIGIVGKYISLPDSYLSVVEAVRHAGIALKVRPVIRWIDSEDLEDRDPHDLLGGLAGIIVPGGFGQRGIEGKIMAAHYARTRKVPYLGLCLGMQVAVIEFARKVLGTDDCTSTEFNPDTKHPVIHPMPEYYEVANMGGSMRLGAKDCEIVDGTRTRNAYGVSHIKERHRHRLEFNNKYRDILRSQGMTLSGFSPDGELVEIVELDHHPWFIGSQFHPEFSSRPTRPHPLFQGFLEAAVRHVEGRRAVAKPVPEVAG